MGISAEINQFNSENQMEEEKDENAEVPRNRRSLRLSKNVYGKRRRESATEAEEEVETRSKMTKTDFTLDDLKAYMNGEFLSNINETMDRNHKKLSDRMDKTQKDLRIHKDHVERELSKMRAEIGSNKNPGPDLGLTYAGATAAGGSSGTEKKSASKGEREEKQYWRARRSARFFPIEGVTEQELRQSVEHFCTEKLRIPAADFNQRDIEGVRRVRMRRGKESQQEVIVLFEDIETRDRITSYARNLSQFIDSAGKPTAGIRFEIPDHLSGVHRTLLQYGHAMWNKHKRDPGFKRNVRFDDIEMTYVLDIKFPKKLKWITVSYARALRDRRASYSAEAEDEDQEELLSTAGEIQEEQLGIDGAGGSVVNTSWRAPQQK